MKTNIFFLIITFKKRKKIARLKLALLFPLPLWCRGKKLLVVGHQRSPLKALNVLMTSLMILSGTFSTEAKWLKNSSLTANAKESYKYHEAFRGERMGRRGEISALIFNSKHACMQMQFDQLNECL